MEPPIHTTEGRDSSGSRKQESCCGLFREKYPLRYTAYYLESHFSLLKSSKGVIEIRFRTSLEKGDTFSLKDATPFKIP